MELKLTGKIIAALERRGGVSQKTGNQWASQEFVLETHEQYPKRMLFDVFGVDQLQRYNIQVGVEYDVYFNVDANEYNGKWYNHIRAYDVRLASAMPPMPTKVHNADGTTEVQGMPVGVPENSLGF